jgi:hypothetical protein
MDRRFGGSLDGNTSQQLRSAVLLRREALSVQEFLADLREKGTRLNVVILDACRENPFEQVAGRSIGSRRGLAVAEPPPEGTFIMYSAGAGESALDRLDDMDRDPNSVFTRNLLPLLRTPGVTLTDVAEQVRVSVRQDGGQGDAYPDAVLLQPGARARVPGRERMRVGITVDDDGSAERSGRSVVGNQGHQ